MFKKGQKVKLKLTHQIMEVIGFEPEFIENILTEWEDDEGTIIKGKFMDAELEPVE
ncbi:hypothetical protein ACRASX_15770 [Flavobacterium sp. TMP13]|uniref:hypothetical protein n=1 Tax=Flavobacterium sp. TMP13 TaxID=3425950 RepID=UPI003D788566